MACVRAQIDQDMARARLAQSAVAYAFNVSPSEIQAPTRRSRKTSHARQAAMYLAHVAFEISLSRVGQAFGVLIVGVIGALAWYTTRQAICANRLCQWPYATGVLSGLLWWLFAAPSLLGWLLVAASLWGALRLPMPSRKVSERSAEPQLGS